jgi:hypothetical protein
MGCPDGELVRLGACAGVQADIVSDLRVWRMSL